MPTFIIIVLKDQNWLSTILKAKSQVIFEYFHHYVQKYLKFLVIVFLPLESVNSTQYLYTTNYNVIDFNADDNGLWIIHATPDSNHTIVSKINDTNLEFINSFNISVHHHKASDFLERKLTNIY